MAAVAAGATLEEEEERGEREGGSGDGDKDDGVDKGGVGRKKL